MADHKFYYHIDNGGYDITFDDMNKILIIEIGFFGYSYHSHKFTFSKESISILLRDLNVFYVLLVDSIKTGLPVDFKSSFFEANKYFNTIYGFDVEKSNLFFDDKNHSKVVLGEIFNLKFIESFIKYLESI